MNGRAKFGAAMTKNLMGSDPVNAENVMRDYKDTALRKMFRRTIPNNSPTCCGYCLHVATGPAPIIIPKVMGNEAGVLAYTTNVKLFLLFCLVHHLHHAQWHTILTPLPMQDFR
ncbi:hypothetical protein VNO77_13491 [Canavalia gladiata]|uniref:Uncharacterized protein n=1 Tax=Canavalia gladiata TaxID=3824 RepID=A0AAN9QV01_CANGL